MMKKGIKKVLLSLALFFGLAFTFFPLIWTVTNAFKMPQEYFLYQPSITAWLPREPTLKNFEYVFIQTRSLVYMLNSFIIGSVTTLFVLLLGTPAAYSLARFKLGGDRLAEWILSMRMIPPIVTVIPLFILFSDLGLVDTPLGLILVYTAYNLPFAIWLMMGFFREVPVEIEEAALVDGGSRFKVFTKISLPLVAPGLVVTTIFTFIFSWNEFLFALILTRENARTIPIQLSFFEAPFIVPFGEMSALSLVTITPVIVLTLAIQKYLVRGLTFGALKG